MTNVSRKSARVRVVDDGWRSMTLPDEFEHGRLDITRASTRSSRTTSPLTWTHPRGSSARSTRRPSGPRVIVLNPAPSQICEPGGEPARANGQDGATTLYVGMRQLCHRLRLAQQPGLSLARRRPERKVSMTLRCSMFGSKQIVRREEQFGSDPGYIPS